MTSTVAVLQVPLVDSLLIAIEARQAVEHAYRSDLLAVVLWSLATAVGIVILLVSVGWLVNIRIYKNDLNTMRGELDAGLRADFDRDLKKLTQAIQGQVEEIMRQNQALFEAKAAELATMVHGDRYSRFIQVARDHWHEGNVGAAIVACSLALGTALDSGVSYLVGESLGLMVEILETKEALSHSERDRLEKHLQRVPNENALLRDRALRALAEGPIRPSP
ncbi:MAG: hypothetical protein WEG36_12160 [Gemmatimonadota bacterium]